MVLHVLCHHAGSSFARPLIQGLRSFHCRREPWCCWTRASTCRTAPQTCKHWAATSWWHRVRLGGAGLGLRGGELRPLCPSFPLPAAQAAVACTPPIKHSLKPAAVSCGPVRIWFLLRLSLAGHKMLAPTASGFMWGRSARDESVARNQGARAPAAALSVGGELLCLPPALLLRMLCG